MSLEEHLAALLHQVSPLEPLDITLREALGCQVVGDVVAPRPLPHFERCAIAGYAVRAGDVPAAGADLKVVDDVAPGFAASQPVYAGVVVRVAAGTALPSGADAVIPGPDAPVGQPVSLAGPVTPGAGITPVAGEAAAGTVVLPDGAMVDARVIGLLAALGEVRVPVRPRPRVVVLTVGNDLVAPGEPATDGLVFDSAGPLLAAAAREHGAVSYRVGPVASEDRAVAEAVDDQLIRADLVIVVGDLAPGSRIRRQLAGLGSVSYDEGSTNPGPFGHGVMGEEQVPLLALPGDPAAAAVLFAVLAVPMIHTMRGVGVPQARTVTLGAPVDRAEVLRLVPARLSRGEAVPVGDGGRVTLPEVVAADAVVRILPGSGPQPRGSQVLALPLRAG